jgi:YebC/PmpR family DNA-binding regulatory protein
MPRENIERAIKKGAGLLDETVSYETVTYEGFAPHRIPVIVECLTDNKNRTATNIRMLFRKGQLGTTGSVSWDFAHVGLVDATPPEGADAEEAAIEAGAQDFEADGEGGFRFYTEATDLDAVAKALSARGWTVATMRLGWKAKNPQKLEDAAARTEVEQFLHEIDDDDDVQHLYVGLQ